MLAKSLNIASCFIANFYVGHKKHDIPSSPQILHMAG